jgi:hypothetical protein
MTTNEDNEFIEQMMVKCDVLMTVEREATQVLEGSVMEQEVTEENFSRSSR